MVDLPGDPCGNAIMAATSAWVRSNKGCRIGRSSHGWSLIATEEFGQGDVILEECPVMSGLPGFPPGLPDELKLTSLEGLRESEWTFALHVVFPKDDPVRIDVDFLTKDLAMFAPLDSQAAASYRNILATLLGSSRLQEKMLLGLLMGKFSSFPCGESRCLFGLLGKLNHSCYPNCVCLWPTSLLETPYAQLRAVTRIRRGEELTFSYLGNDFPLRVRSVEGRREKLFRGFEFHCSCELCEAKEPKTYGQLCKRAIAFGKPPPLPKSISAQKRGWSDLGFWLMVKERNMSLEDWRTWNNKEQDGTTSFGMPGWPGHVKQRLHARPQQGPQLGETFWRRQMPRKKKSALRRWAGIGTVSLPVCELAPGCEWHLYRTFTGSKLFVYRLHGWILVSGGVICCDFAAWPEPVWNEIKRDETWLHSFGYKSQGRPSLDRLVSWQKVKFSAKA